MTAARRRAIHSMTGYGRATKSTPLGAVTVELRSTNHRFLELEQRLPPGCASLQGQVAELLRQHFQRGRIEVLVVVQGGRWTHQTLILNEPLLARYHDILVALKSRFGLTGAVTLDQLLSLPQAGCCSPPLFSAGWNR